MPLMQDLLSFRELMAEYGITRQVEVCRRTGLAKQYVSYLWNGKINLGREVANRLSEQLGIPLERLMTLRWVAHPRQRGPGRPRKEGSCD
jgi:transcriptional regulator with XRE-family HTH domain